MSVNKLVAPDLQNLDAAHPIGNAPLTKGQINAKIIIDNWFYQLLILPISPSTKYLFYQCEGSEGYPETWFFRHL
jgi:hypothetical protein